MAHIRYNSTILLAPLPDSIKNWDIALKSSELKTQPRHVIFQTHPDPYLGWGAEMSGRAPSGEDEWESWEPQNEFFESMAKLKGFPNIESVELTFTGECEVERSPYKMPRDVPEGSNRRVQILQNFFAAVNEHNSEHGRKMRSLSIKNLQNEIQRIITESEEFKQVHSGLRELHLQICTEYADFSGEGTIDFPEVKTFPPHLKNTWLKPIATQLNVLTLYYDTPWGTIPNFDMESLHFSNLTSLALGNYTFSSDTQLGWILSHKKLKSLTLDDCPIVHHFSLDDMFLKVWKVNEKGLEKTETGNDEYKIVLLDYGARWHTYFDKIQNGLPNLEEFQIGSGAWDNYRAFEGRHKLGADLVQKRYMAFNFGVGPSQWIEPDGHDGNYAPGSFWDDEYMGIKTTCPANECSEEDGKALAMLLEEVKRRSSVFEADV